MARPGIALWIVSVGLLGLTGAWSSAPRMHASAAQVPRVPVRVAAMRHHFAQVGLVHEAITRGDLAGMRTAAEQLARLPAPGGLAPAATPFVTTLRRAARNAADARTLAEAAAAAGSMLLQCGGCHRALGVRPNVAAERPPDVGGVVGHMLDHERAVQDLLEGLVVPSAAQWRLGAERLRDAEVLQAGKLPADPKWTSALRLAEQRVHAIARGAVGDETPEQRADHYANIVTTCAQCHSLHSRVWGPTSGR